MESSGRVTPLLLASGLQAFGDQASGTLATGAGTGTEHSHPAYRATFQWPTVHLYFSSYVAVRGHLAGEPGGRLKGTVAPFVLSQLCKLVVVCPCWAEGGFISPPRRGRSARMDAASGRQVMAIMAGKPAPSHRTTQKAQLSQFRNK